MDPSTTHMASARSRCLLLALLCSCACGSALLALLSPATLAASLCATVLLGALRLGAALFRETFRRAGGSSSEDSDGGARAPSAAAHARARLAAVLASARSSGSDGLDDFELLLALDDSPSSAALSRGMTAAELATLPTHRFAGGGVRAKQQRSAAPRRAGSCAGDGGSPACAVCLEAYASGELLRTLPCLHRYHAACADTWLVDVPQCPVCRTHCLEGGDFAGSSALGGGGDDLVEAPNPASVVADAAASHAG